MKRELIEKALTMFEKDKKIIIDNLVLVNDNISLEVADENYKVTIKIGIEKKEN